MHLPHFAVAFLPIKRNAPLHEKRNMTTYMKNKLQNYGDRNRMNLTTPPEPKQMKSPHATIQKLSKYTNKAWPISSQHEQQNATTAIHSKTIAPSES